MNRLNRKFGIVAIACLFGTLVFSQSLYFRTETYNVVPRGTNYSIQVGVFLEYDAEGVGADPAGWDTLECNMTYTFPDNTRLSAEPVIHGVDFPTETETGLQNPADPIPGSPNPAAANNTNNVIENGVPAVGFLNTQTGATPLLETESVTPTVALQSGSIRFAAAALTPWFETASNTEYLFMIIDFPISGSAGSFVFDIAFDTSDPFFNFLQRSTAPALQLFASCTDGQISVFAPTNCSGATVADNLGAASGTSIGIDYLDPSAGGVGGDITFTMPYTAGLVDQIRVEGSDMYSNTFAASGTPPDTLTINTQGDSSPSTGADSVTYSIYYEVEFPPASGTFIAGTPCTVTVTWNQPSCSMAWDATPVAGSSTNLDVTMYNVMDMPPFGTVTSTATNWGADVDLTAPTAMGNQLTFDDAYSIASVNANDIGTYSIGTVTGPGVGNTSSCQVNLFLECPTNTTACNITPAQVLIGSNADVDYSGTNVADWVVTYDGTTQNLGPGTSGTATFGPVVGDALTVDVDATGFDPTGAPCNDLVTCTLDFEAPTCDNLTQTPDTQVTPADPGTVIALTVDTTNAISCEIDIEGVPTPMTPGADPLTTYGVTWSYNYTAFYPTTLVVTVTNPDGEFTTCSWPIDVSCNAAILGVASPGTIGGVTIEGIGSATGLVYDIYYAADCSAGAGDPLPAGAVLAGQITLVGAGPNVVGVGPAGHAIQPDVCYYVTCGGSGVVLDRFGARTVPTLGEWGLIVFAVILMGAGVFFMRRRRTA